MSSLPLNILFVPSFRRRPESRKTLDAPVSSVGQA